jgi:hypothetical protein
MAKPKTIVDGVSSLSAPPEMLTAKTAGPPSGLVTVQFLGGQAGFLDMADARSAVWAEVLDSMRQNNQPAYVEIDPRTNVITELHCPIVVGVAAIHPADNSGDVEVELLISHARHFLRKGHPDFKENLEILQAALKNKTMVAATESTDGHEIIDVRPLDQSEAGKEE